MVPLRVWKIISLFYLISCRLFSYVLYQISENLVGYQPCDPQYIKERIQQLESAYIELVQLATDRHNHLIESRKLWQFFWDMAEEEAWIKEKERILSSGDIGHDLTAIHLLISKNKVFLVY